MGTFSGFKPSVLINFLKTASGVVRSESGCGKKKTKIVQIIHFLKYHSANSFPVQSVITDYKVEITNSTPPVWLHIPPSASFLHTDELDPKFSDCNLRKTALPEFLSLESPVPSH
jgi:hypothetical protein